MQHLTKFLNVDGLAPSFADFCQKSFLRVFGAAAVLLVLDEGNHGLVLQNNFSC